MLAVRVVLLLICTLAATTSRMYGEISPKVLSASSLSCRWDLRKKRNRRNKTIMTTARTGPTVNPISSSGLDARVRSAETSVVLSVMLTLQNFAYDKANGAALASESRN